MRPSTKFSFLVLAALLLAFQPQPVQADLLGGLLSAVGSVVTGAVTTVGTVVGDVVGVVCTLESLVISTVDAVVTFPFVSSQTSGYDIVYVSYDVDTIYLKGTSTNPAAGLYISYNHGLIATLLTLISSLLGSGVQSAAISLSVGNNYLSVAVTGLCTCTYTFTVCRNPKSGTQGDPIFNGMLGQEFQVHGVSGEVYSIISDETMQMNSRFIFLHKGDCPELNGIRAQACWSHPGSYLGEIGIKTNGGDRIFIGSGSAENGFAKVQVNDRDIELDEVNYLKTEPISGAESSLVARKAVPDTPYIVRNSSHLLTVQLSNFQLAIENSDYFMNYRLYVLDWNALAGTHGLLGQTHQKPSKPGSQIKEIEGNVDDYQIGDHSIFGDDFAFNRFNLSGGADQVGEGDSDSQRAISLDDIETESTKLLEGTFKFVGTVVDTVKSELKHTNQESAKGPAFKKRSHFGGRKRRHSRN